MLFLLSYEVFLRLHTKMEGQFKEIEIKVYPNDRIWGKDTLTPHLDNRTLFLEVSQEHSIRYLARGVTSLRWTEERWRNSLRDCLGKIANPYCNLT